MATILIVDDKMISQLILETILRRNNHTVVTVDNSRDALSALAENHIDLVITEIMIPGMDGLTFLRQLRAARKKEDLPVIVLTAASAAHWRTHARQMGADILFNKPIGSQELLQAIDKLLKSPAPVQQDMQPQYMQPRLGWT